MKEMPAFNLPMVRPAAVKIHRDLVKGVEDHFSVRVQSCRKVMTAPSVRQHVRKAVLAYFFVGSFGKEMKFAISSMLAAALEGLKESSA